MGAPVEQIIAVAIGIVVFIAFAIAARLTAPAAAKALRRRQLRPDQVVIGGRVVTFVLIGLGAIFAISFAIQSANVALFGIVLATVIASFGVQDLLKDYVSGYYVLLERHIRVGDRISIDVLSGTVTEIKLRVTLLHSDAGDLIIFPNSELFNRPVTVHGRVAMPAPEATPTPPG
ncbi:MAG TPA: mechanosensitive ion channel domain-containing protein [Candidatus Dormibacteraeota bacterium]|nr:mechanosensitive ion channel domain-containing protein [Candidatus Dormibacteraeota bacterium]